MTGSVVIYRAQRKVTQSSKLPKGDWFLAYLPENPDNTDNVMGWKGGENSSLDIKLGFSSKEEAISYAKDEGLDFEVLESGKKGTVSKCYADNFVYCPVKPD